MIIATRGVNLKVNYTGIRERSAFRRISGSAETKRGQSVNLCVSLVPGVHNHASKSAMGVDEGVEGG